MYRYTYIVECRANHVTRPSSDDFKFKITYYVGGTNDIHQRIAAHRAGKGARYLRGRQILRVAYVDTWMMSEELAWFYSEHAIKRFTHLGREKIVNDTHKPDKIAFWRAFPI